MRKAMSLTIGFATVCLGFVLWYLFGFACLKYGAVISPNSDLNSFWGMYNELYLIHQGSGILVKLLCSLSISVVSALFIGIGIVIVILLSWGVYALACQFPQIGNKIIELGDSIILKIGGFISQKAASTFNRIEPVERWPDPPQDNEELPTMVESHRREEALRIRNLETEARVRRLHECFNMPNSKPNPPPDRLVEEGKQPKERPKRRIVIDEKTTD